MSRIWVIARMSLLENSRKQVFHVLCLILLTLIVSSTLLSVLTEGVKLKMLKDLCMTCIMFGGAVLAIALGATAIPNDVESRTIHPVMARPVTRAHYVVGKYLGTLLTVALGVFAMSLVFGVLIYGYQHRFDAFLPISVLFALLSVAVVAAVATAISTVATPAVSAVLSFLIYVLGTIKIGYLGGVLERAGDGISRAVLGVVYHTLPNLECFNLKDALVHQNVIPSAYLWQAALYGLFYAAFVLFLGSMHFRRKEI